MSLKNKSYSALIICRVKLSGTWNFNKKFLSLKFISGNTLKFRTGTYFLRARDFLISFIFVKLKVEFSILNTRISFILFQHSSIFYRDNSLLICIFSSVSHERSLQIQIQFWTMISAYHDNSCPLLLSRIRSYKYWIIKKHSTSKFW